MSGSIERARVATDMVKTLTRDTITTAKEIMNLRRVVLSAVCLWAFCVLSFLNFVKQFVEPFYRLFFAARHPVLVRTPENWFISLSLEDLGYTFASNYIEVPFGGCGGGSTVGHPRMHYVDEFAGEDKDGATKTVLCLHGEPTWSFLFRKMVPVLTQAGYRVVVPDMIGFGKSDKYVDMDNYNHELHTFAVKHLINELGLGSGSITLVGSGLGGTTGLSVAKDMPDRFGNLVLMNTPVSTGFDEQAFRKSPFQNTFAALPFLVIRAAVSLLGAHLPIETFFRRVEGLRAAEAKAYAAPFPDATYKAGPATWPLMVPLYRDDPVAQHMVEVKSLLRTWQKPALVVFDENDLAGRQSESYFADSLSHKSIVLSGAGHFIPETHGKEVAESIVEFLGKQVE